MKIALFAHELVPEIGHSRALIETINHIPSDKIDHLYVVSFEMGNPQEIFPELKNRITFIEVPKFYFGPFLIKMLYFFIASWFITKLKLSSDVKKVGIGIASLSVDYVNVQFVHKEWEHFYFSRFKFPIYKYLYKKLLFFFFWLGENYLYRIKSHTQFSILSEFEQDYMTSHFNIPKEHTILNYSGINLDNFDFINESKEEVLNELISDYPQMTKLELNQPIYLFVGAFERKGLNLVIDKIRSVPNAQLLVVGRPESAKGFSLPDDLNITYVEFTKKIQKFYHLADVFVFPTIYEPFGLVLVEAACMGLEVYTTEYKVGASELLRDMDNIHLFKKPEDIVITPRTTPLTLDEKRALRQQRRERLASMTWEKTGERFYELLSRS